VDHPKIEVTRVVSIPFEENTYIIRVAGRSDCLVVDPGLEPEKILDELDSQGLVPGAILNTHGHSDHIGGNAALKQRWPECPLVIGSAEAAKLTDPRRNLSSMFGVHLVSPPADVTVDDGEVYTAAGIEVRVLAIPGHSGGHVVYLCEGNSPPLALVGDVIFAGSIGRTDFPDGDFQQLRAGIHAKLFTLPEHTLLLPGHGEATTVGQERRTNPFVRLPPDPTSPGSRP
jgi:hydroxyacylglutathione hydrolase